MFFGEFQHNFDQKGRVIMPVKLREGLKDKFMITKGIENCLFVFSAEAFSKIKEKTDSLALTDKDVRAFSRFFFAGAFECEVDKQGRITIPGYLREYAGLNKESYILGVSSRVEIWSSENWKNYISSDDASPDMFAEKMALLGI